MIMNHYKDDTNSEETQPRDQSSLVNSFSRKAFLAKDYVLHENDVICGRGQTCFQHVGNVRFRKIVAKQLQRYLAAKTKTDKSVIIHEIIQHVRATTPTIGGGFVKYDKATNRYYDVGDFVAREKTSQAFRDILHEQYKSSNTKKRQQRKLRRQAAVTKQVQAERIDSASTKRNEQQQQEKKSSLLSIPSTPNEDMMTTTTTIPHVLLSRKVSSSSTTNSYPIEPETCMSFHTSADHEASAAKNRKFVAKSYFETQQEMQTNVPHESMMLLGRHGHDDKTKNASIWWENNMAAKADNSKYLPFDRKLVLPQPSYMNDRIAAFHMQQQQQQYQQQQYEQPLAVENGMLSLDDWVKNNIRGISEMMMSQEDPLSTYMTPSFGDLTDMLHSI